MFSFTTSYHTYIYSTFLHASTKRLDNYDVSTVEIINQVFNYEKIITTLKFPYIRRLKSFVVAIQFDPNVVFTGITYYSDFCGSDHR